MEPQHLHKLRPDYGAVLLGLDRLPDQIEEKTLTLFDRNQFQATSSVDRTIGSNAITDCTSVNTGPLGFKNISARKVITPQTVADLLRLNFCKNGAAIHKFCCDKAVQGSEATDCFVLL